LFSLLSVDDDDADEGDDEIPRGTQMKPKRLMIRSSLLLYHRSY
jgi:hypothetical protein